MFQAYRSPQSEAREAPVLGTYGKSAGGLHCSYSRCGGCNCDVAACLHHQDNTDPNADHSCYGPRFQAAYPALRRKLARHELMGSGRGILASRG